MDKEATDLLNLALLSLLSGAGGYGGMRLLKDLPNEGKQPQPTKNELDITLPAARFPKMANETSIGTYFWPAVVGLGGAAGGFYGASSIYEKIKQKQLEDELKSTNQDYMGALQQAHQKVASVQTPHTDALLEGLFTKIGQEIEKAGWVQPEFLGSEGPIDVLKHQVRNAGNTFFDSDLGKITGAGMLLAALGAAGGTYGISKKMDNDREDLKSQSTLPTDIRLHVSR